MKRVIFALLVIAAGSIPTLAKYSGGTGDPNNPYKIATKADLLALRDNTGDYGKCFILTADINMEGQVFTTAIIAPDTSSSVGFQGTAFTGIFDGNGLKITNFTINGGSNQYLGLFGQINSGGSVKNLGLEDCSVSGQYDLGGLVGYNYGSISNCYSTGLVNNDSSGSTNVGGLVGRNGGSIRNCYSTGPVNGSFDSFDVGGLVGYHTGGYISNCYSTGDVTGDVNSGYESGGLSGGLVGYSESNISDCYSTGAVSGFSGVGGLVGYIESGNISDCYSTGAVSSFYDLGGLVGWNSGSISNCYSTGAVNGSWDNIGGLVGYSDVNNGGTISSSYFLITRGPNNGYGTPLTDGQMKQQSSFLGWDFDTIWTISEGISYPELAWQLPTLPEKAAELAKQVIGADYLWGGKGWDWSAKKFVDAGTITAGYTYSWEPAWGKGLDCSGLVFWSYNYASGAINYLSCKPPWNPIEYEGADGQYYHNVIQMDKSTPKRDLLPGDLLFFFNLDSDNKIDHVVMYVGDFSYPGGTILGTTYPAGTYDIVAAQDPDHGIVPQKLTKLVRAAGFVGFGRVTQPAVDATFCTKCPVDIILTDPDGFIVSKDTPEIPGLLYFSVYDIDGNGRPDEMVTVPKIKVGTYLITVVPEPNVLPTDTYSLEAIINGQTMVLAKDVQIQNIPAQPYEVKSDLILVTKCTVTAGSKVNSDAISFSGTMDPNADDFNDTNNSSDANFVEVTINSDNIVNPCVITFPVNGKTWKKGKFNYSGKENGVKKSFTYNVKTGKFAFAASNINLSGLECPVIIDINVGDFADTANLDEAIVNGPKKPIPINLLMGVKNSLRVDGKPKFTKKSGSITQFAVSGGFSVENPDVNMTNRVSEGLVITLGTQTFTIPANNLKAGKNKFTCSKVKLYDGSSNLIGIATATFDFNKCTFTLTIKNVDITSSGTVDFCVQFAGFNECVPVSLP
ncbi:MAG: GLUG motif-containing protein [Sedimentisphaerales bacterium]|jgi:hypothetical protein